LNFTVIIARTETHALRGPAWSLCAKLRNHTAQLYESDWRPTKFEEQPVVAPVLSAVNRGWTLHVNSLWTHEPAPSSTELRR